MLPHLDEVSECTHLARASYRDAVLTRWYRDRFVLVGDSAQPVNDTWITTKVKADLMATSDVPGTTIDVDTTNGVVKLSGSVDTKAQHDKAIAVAKNIKGVKSVDATALSVAKGGDR